MNKVKFIVLFLMITSALFSQTIVWKQLSSLPEGFYCGEAVALNNDIYFVAGRNDVLRTSFFYKFNPKTNHWTKLTDMPKPMMNLALAAVNGKIYAIGGDRFLNDNYAYTPETNTWATLSPMPTGRQHIDCGIFDNNIFVMGGLTSWKVISKKNEVYNIAANTWSEKAAVPSLRNCSAIVTKDSLIYVIGGGGSETSVWDNIASVECYHIESDTWEKKADLPYKLYKPAAIVVKNELVVLGGSISIEGKSDSVNKVLIYKPESDKWIETTPLPVKNIFFGCTSIENKIYIIGGTAGSTSKWKSYSNVYEGELITH